MMTRFHETIDTLRLERDEACAEIARLKREIARLTAPPGASAKDLANKLEAEDKEPWDEDFKAAVIGALEEAERRGREAMREEAAQIADEHPDELCRADDPEGSRGCCEVIASAIRALPLDPPEPRDG